MKKKFKIKKITFRHIALLVGLSAVLWIFVQPRVGLFSIIIKVSEQKSVARSIEEYNVKTVLQKRKIDRLKNDSEYIEKIIREEMNMIENGEKVIKR